MAYLSFIDFFLATRASDIDSEVAGAAVVLRNWYRDGRLDNLSLAEFEAMLAASAVSYRSSR